MANTYSVYCDESAHLENDQQKAMVLGAVWCPTDSRHEINERLVQIRRRHDLKDDFEIKWTKVSPAKVGFYLDVIDYFFDNTELSFRGLVVPDKGKLNHEAYANTHDDWYYRMYFVLLKAILDNDNYYKIYLDIKDTGGGKKVESLHQVLSNNIYDFNRNVVQNIQLVRSHEIGILQICDLLIGAVMAVNRGTDVSPAKLELINRIKLRSSYDLTRRTLIKEQKFNLFVWHQEDVES